MGLRPSQNCTVPVAAAGLTAAETLTVSPHGVCAGWASNDTVLEPLATSCGTGCDWLGS